ncbi:hypothetical protein SAMN05444008_11934 [Cnuella takakiae]|uniref:Uncharacterized protein n=1 Tax=Cnuella takakiae TaxID=1302690 RepID=A0A1M5HFD9_9BACT|nr:hypothetical protein [Cnuella takakiae]OLY92852.1 hypothetical protein BUE76_13870 [Cnuella takakiae]SHG14651.1 hypothetical protein SAMN05444008_11934 [Cnuella takakiae]
MLRFLDLRVVINERSIYPLLQQEALYIPSHQQVLTLVVTDGFHITPRLEVPLPAGKVCRLYVGCRIDNEQLLIGLLSTILFYCTALFSGWLWARVITLMPLLYGLYQYYFRRSQFLTVRIQQG